MIKSLPIENILSNKSLSSKKSVKVHSNDFRDVLQQTSIESKNSLQSKQKPENEHLDTTNKKEIHIKDNKNKDKSSDTEYVAINNHNAQENIKTDKKVENDKLSKHIIKKPKTNTETKTIKTKELVRKNTKVFTTKNKKLINSDENSNKENKKILDEKVIVKHINKNEISKIVKMAIKEKAQNTNKTNINKKQKEELDTQMNIDKIVVKNGKKEKIKHLEETIKKISTKNTTRKQENRELNKEETIKNKNITTSADKKESKIQNLSSNFKSNDKQTLSKLETAKTQIGIKAELKIGNNSQDSAGFLNKQLNVKEIKDKYVKKLNIKKIVVSHTETKSKNEKIIQESHNSRKLKLTNMTEKNINTENNLKKTDTPSNQIQTNTKIVQEANKSIKIKTIKDIKNDKVLKISISQINDKNQTKSDITKVLSFQNKVKEKSVKENSINIKEISNSNKTLQNIKNVSIERNFEQIPNILSKKNDKKFSIKNSDIAAFQQTTTQIQIHNMQNTNNISTPYPMDKIIENIDKIMNMKPPFNNTVTIKLNPPHIGVLELQVKMDRDKNISAVITADDKSVLKIVSSHIDGLKTYLNSQGIKVSHIDVHNGFHEQANFGNSQNQGTFGNGQQNNTGSNRFGNFEGTFSNKETIKFKGGSDYKRVHSVKGLDITV